MRERTWIGRGERASRAGVRSGLLSVLLLFSAAAAVSQVAPATQPGPSTNTRPGLGHDPFGSPDPINAPNPRRLEHMREDERHKRLVADTARLVELTNELKADLEKASKDELSLDVVRKAAEIEKLAHDVKERMKS